MTEARVVEIETALRGTRGDPEFASAWLTMQTDIRVLTCSPEHHPELVRRGSPYDLVLFAAEEGMHAFLPNAPADRAGDWLDRIGAALDQGALQR